MPAFKLSAGLLLNYSRFEMRLFSKTTQFITVLLATLPLLIGDVHAAPTMADLELFMRTTNIPLWQAASSKMKKIRQNPPDTQAVDTWDQLDAETDDKTGRAPLFRATQPRDAKELLDISTWLKWRILSENADGRYAYVYARNLLRMKDKDGGYEKEAAAYFYLGRLSLSIDGARCADQASPGSIAMRYESSMASLQEKIDQLPKPEKATAMLEAVSIERMRGDRASKGYLCMSGAQTVMRALAAGEKTEPVKQDSAESPGQLGIPHTIDASGLEPGFVPEEAWHKKRRSIMNQHIKDAIDLL